MITTALNTAIRKTKGPVIVPFRLSGRQVLVSAVKTDLVAAVEAVFDKKEETGLMINDDGYLVHVDVAGSPESAERVIEDQIASPVADVDVDDLLGGATPDVDIDDLLG